MSLNHATIDNLSDTDFNPTQARHQYSSALAVIDAKDLSRDQKYAVLTQWRVDLEQQSEATAEGMEGRTAEHGARLREVSQALLALDQNDDG